MHILVELSEKNQKVDPKQILVQLFDEKLKLYQDIQLVLHIASYAPTKSIIDSVIESIVSSYECLSDPRINTKATSVSYCGATISFRKLGYAAKHNAVNKEFKSAIQSILCKLSAIH